MTIAEFFDLVVAVFYFIAIVLLVTVLPWIFIKKRQDTKKLEKHIKEKIEKGIELEPKDITALGKSLNLGPVSARKPIYSLLLQYDEKDKFETINKLRKEIEIEEPFDDMPDEVKPSLVRISKLVEEAGSDGDRHLLLPVHKALAKYVELESEREKIKGRAHWGMVITIVSVLMGAFSFYQSFKAPTLEQIREAVRSESATDGAEDNKRVN